MQMFVARSHGLVEVPMYFFPKLRRGLIAGVMSAITALAVGTAHAQSSQIDPHGVKSPTTGLVEIDGLSKQRVMAAIMAQLDRYALHMNNLFYARFAVAPNAVAPQQQSRSFPAPVVPQGAAIVRQGLIEITPFNWSVSIVQSPGSNSWNGEVSLRLFKYRVFTPEQGLQASRTLALHFWQWDVHIDSAGLRLSMKVLSPGTEGASAPQELVASIYNVPASTVTVSAPSTDFVQRVVNGGR